MDRDLNQSIDPLSLPTANLTVSTLELCPLPDAWDGCPSTLDTKRNHRMRSVENNMVFGRFGPAAIPDTTSNDASIQEFLAFERMLADLSARFANIPIENVESEMRLAQVILLPFLEFDRFTFPEFQDDGPVC